MAAFWDAARLLSRQHWPHSKSAVSKSISCGIIPPSAIISYACTPLTSQKLSCDWIPFEGGGGARYTCANQETRLWDSAEVNWRKARVGGVIVTSPGLKRSMRQGEPHDSRNPRLFDGGSRCWCDVTRPSPKRVVWPNFKCVCVCVCVCVSPFHVGYSSPQGHPHNPRQRRHSFSFLSCLFSTGSKAWTSPFFT